MLDDEVLKNLIKSRIKVCKDIGNYYIVAGGSVSNIILNYYHPECPAVINDIDVYVFDRKVVENNKETVKVLIDNLYNKDYLCFTTHHIFKIENEEEFQYIYVNDTRNVIYYFDLNCCQSSYNFMNDRLSYTKDFEKFIKTKEIKISNYFSYQKKSLLRALKKRDELNCYFNINMYYTICQHVISQSSLYHKNEVYDHIVDMFSLNESNLITDKDKKLFNMYKDELINAKYNAKFKLKMSFGEIEGLYYDSIYSRKYNYSFLHIYLSICNFQFELTPEVKAFINIYKPLILIVRKYGSIVINTKINKNQLKILLSSKFKISVFYNIFSIINVHLIMYGINKYINYDNILLTCIKLYKVNKETLKEFKINALGIFEALEYEQKIKCLEEDFKNIKEDIKILLSKRVLFYAKIDTSSIESCTIKELVTQLELIEEGNVMHHCVSGYFRKILNGESRIFSIITENDRTTLEVSLHTNEIVQHSGLSNKRPHKDNINIAKQIHELLKGMVKLKEDTFLP